MAEARTKNAANRRAGASAAALDALAESVESGAGLPETARCAAAALQATVALIDSRGAVLAVAAASPAEERELLSKKDGVTAIDLRVSEAVVGQLRFRVREDVPEPAVLRLVTTLLALEVERTRAPERAGEAAVGSFVNAVLDGDIDDRRDLVARGKEMGVDLEHGGSVLAVRIYPRRAGRGRLAGARADDRRTRGAGRRPRCAQHPARRADRGDRPRARTRRSAAAPHRPCCARWTTACRASRSWSAAAGSPSTRWTCTARRARHCWLRTSRRPTIATPESRLLSFEDTGAYRLLLPAMSDDPAELERFYLDTIAPLVAYDEQYGTELVHTLEAFLANDGSMAATYKQLFTHRHTIRYRLERIKELAGLDVNSTDGRERLGLGPEGDARARACGRRARRCSSPAPSAAASRSRRPT